LKQEASAVDAAIEAVLKSGQVTADLRPPGRPATTEQVGDAICAAIG
jgi:3-isopropylmalate dehydrogenase